MEKSNLPLVLLFILSIFLAFNNSLSSPIYSTKDAWTLYLVCIGISFNVFYNSYNKNEIFLLLSGTFISCGIIYFIHSLVYISIFSLDWLVIIFSFGIGFLFSFYKNRNKKIYLFLSIFFIVLTFLVFLSINSINAPFFQNYNFFIPISLISFATSAFIVDKINENKKLNNDSNLEGYSGIESDNYEN